MTLADERIAAIRSRLQLALTPQELSVSDESHLHVGHAGARDGRGHFRVRVVSAAFSGKQPLARHRMVYGALGSLLDSDIHALALQTLAPEEAP
jgi:BolA protein